MRIAYAVLCHKNPEQVNKLIGLLTDNAADVYVHIDKKAVRIRDNLIHNKHVTLIPEKDSFSVVWGGIEIVKATLKLIEYIKNSKKHYDYIYLISGQDLPIVNMATINRYLSKKKDCNFIDVMDISSSDYNRYKKLYELWYPKWITKNIVFVKVIKRLYMLFTGGFEYTFKVFRRKKPFDFEFYFGSQWWCLKSNIAYRILDYCKKNDDFLEYFEHSIIPDECVFQTIFMEYFGKEQREASLTYINWKDGRRSPEILRNEDYNLLLTKSRDYLFARKFDIDIDGRIVEKIMEMNQG